MYERVIDRRLKIKYEFGNTSCKNLVIIICCGDVIDNIDLSRVQEFEKELYSIFLNLNPLHYLSLPKKVSHHILINF